MALLALAGCTLGATADRDVASAIARYERERGDTGSAYARPTRAEPSAATAPATQPAEPSSLREYIVTALAENPEIHAAEERARARAAEVAQATGLPDPMLMTRTPVMPIRAADGDNFFNLGVQQTFPAPGKLDHAGRAALYEARAALADVQRRRLDVIADVKRAYFQIYILDRTREVDLTNQDLLRGLIDAARSQVASGRRGQDDVLRAEVELSNIASQLVELRQQRVSAVAALNRTLNRRPDVAVPTVPMFDVRSVDLRLDELLAAAARQNPDLQALAQQIERDRERVKVARLAWWPDVTLGFEWMYMRPRAPFIPPPDPDSGMIPPYDRMSEDGTDNWLITVSLNIPLWADKIQAGIRAAHHELLASQFDYAAAANRVSAEVQDALARVQAQQELAVIFRDTIIPQAQQAYEVSRASYSAGTSEFLFVIDNWQKWLMFTIQYHRALGELERSVADLEAALGQSLSAWTGDS